MWGLGFAQVCKSKLACLLEDIWCSVHGHFFLNELYQSNCGKNCRKQINVVQTPPRINVTAKTGAQMGDLQFILWQPWLVNGDCSDRSRQRERITNKWEKCKRLENLNVQQFLVLFFQLSCQFEMLSPSFQICQKYT